MSDPPPDPLDALGARIELLATDPGEIRLRWMKLAGPVLRLVGWQPTFAVDKTSALIEALRSVKPRKPRARSMGSMRSPAEIAAAAALEAPLTAALEELEANVTSAERACVVRGRVPTSRAAWLRRFYEVVVRAARAARDRADEGKRRVAAAVDRVMLLPPLVVVPNHASSGEGEPESEGASKEAPRSRPKAAPAPEMADGDERLIDLHLSAIDHLLDAARAETEFLGRRRRLLEAARQLLLDSAAALPLDPQGVAARRQHIAEQIVRINRVEAAGISPDVGLLHQAKTALSRGDREKLCAALGELDRVALGRGDGEMAAQTDAALRKLWGGKRSPGKSATAASLERSTAEILGSSTVAAVRHAYAEARDELAKKTRELSPADREEQKPVVAYFRRGGELATLAAAIAVDGCFDVGGALSPVRVEEIEIRARAVAHPTQDLVLVPAREIGDIPGALIDDPRRILLSMAEGRLLTRKFIEHERVSRKKTKLVGEARVYLLDGSTSMLTDGEGRAHGARARMRDAILLAELATLQRRYTEQGKRLRVVLHYRYFTRVLWPIWRVDSADAAGRAMADVVRTPRQGGTDIEGALLASFEEVRKARKADPDLARAQVVLITDGDAVVREEVIREAREKAGDVPVAVSVIALGEENASLRSMVARQRARGERAFYHFIPDAELRAIAAGEVDRGAALHLDATLTSDASRPTSELAEELGGEVGALIDELDSLSKKRHVLAMEAARDEAHTEAYALQALVEVGLGGAHFVAEGERARREALDRDTRALEARFTRWFPAPIESPPQASAPAGPARSPAPDPAPDQRPDPGTPERDDFDSVLIALSTVSEVVREVGGTPLVRRADAIEIVERLLPDARLSPARYLAVLRAYPAAAAAALRAVHAAVR